MAKDYSASQFWSFRRGSWQYDLIVVAILAFIFLTPKQFFADQPRADKVQQIKDLGDDKGTVVFWVDRDVIEAAPQSEAAERVARLIRKRSGRNLRVVETNASEDPEGLVQAYLVYARP